MTEISQVIDGEATLKPAPAAGVEPEGLGHKLRFHREARGLSIDDISQALKIRPNKVMAIEAEQWEVLPSGPYLRGFLRNYAKILQIDPQALIVKIDTTLIRSKTADSILRMPESFESPLPRQPYNPPAAWGGKRLVVFALLLIIIFGVAFVWTSPAANSLRAHLRALIPGGAAMETASLKNEPLTAPVAPVTSPTADANGALAQGALGMEGNPSSSTTLPSPLTPAEPGASTSTTPTANILTTPSTDASTPKDVAAPATVLAPGSVMSNVAAGMTASIPASSALSASSVQTPVLNGVAMSLQFDKDAWVQIKQADGQVLLSKINAAKTQQTVMGTPPFDLIIGNANGVKLRYRDTDFDLSPYIRDNVARLTLK